MVGRTTNLQHTYTTLLKDLQASIGAPFDLFCHTWSDEIPTTNSRRIHPTDMLNSLTPYPHAPIEHMLNPTAITRTSYGEVIQRLIDNPLKTPLQNKNFLFVGYLAPYTSLYHAYNLMSTHEYQNDFKYDIVIKWRYDLLVEPKSREYYYNPQNRQWLVQHKTDAEIADTHFCMTRSTATMLKTYHVQHEKVLRQTIEADNTCINEEVLHQTLQRHYRWIQVLDRRLPGVTIYRDRNHKEGVGWEETVIHPTQGTPSADFPHV